jgi:hypothetical protein
MKKLNIHPQYRFFKLRKLSNNFMAPIPLIRLIISLGAMLDVGRDEKIWTNPD